MADDADERQAVGRIGRIREITPNNHLLSYLPTCGDLPVGWQNGEAGYSATERRARVEHLSELVDKPGTYFIQVEYISPVPREFGQGPDFWSREKPPVWSNKIEVHVTGK